MPATTADRPVMTADEHAVVISRVELVRATSSSSLLRIDVQPGPATDEALLVVRGVGLPRRLTPLPTQPQADGLIRLAFAVPLALREGRFALQLGAREVPLHTPAERTREDAVAAVQVQKLRARVAELEAGAAPTAPAAPMAPGDPQPSGADLDARRQRLEQQLIQHRHMRAELNRELDSARELARAAEEALRAERDARERLEHELASEQQGRADEEARMSGTIEAARARVAYLENRLVELQARSQQLDA